MAPLESPSTIWKIRTRGAGSSPVGRLDVAENGGLLPRTQRGNRLHAAAVFVAEGEAVKKILDGDQAGALEIGGLARADPLQELKRGGKNVIAHSQHHLTDDERLPLSDVDLLDAGGQREGVIQPDAVGAVLGAV